MDRHALSTLTPRALWLLLNVGWFGRLLALLAFNGLVIGMIVGHGVLDVAAQTVLDRLLSQRLFGIVLIDADMAQRLLTIRSLSFGDIVVAIAQGRFFWIDNLMALALSLAVSFATLVMAAVFQLWWEPTIANMISSVLAVLVLVGSCLVTHRLNVRAREEGPEAAWPGWAPDDQGGPQDLPPDWSDPGRPVPSFHIRPDDRPPHAPSRPPGPGPEDVDQERAGAAEVSSVRQRALAAWPVAAWAMLRLPLRTVSHRLHGLRGARDTLTQALGRRLRRLADRLGGGGAEGKAEAGKQHPEGGEQR